ncbi:MAG: hypothetical protein ABI548_16690 [Polyangiaceae bacterium]
MRFGVVLLVFVSPCIAAFGCSGPQLTYAPDASMAGAPDNGGSEGADLCNLPKNSNSSPIGSCLSAAKFVDCTFDSGAGVGCLSNGATTCDGADGATCVDKCASDQFAISCGGPPAMGVTYEDVPANCEVAANTPGGKAYACCSCPGAQ